MRALTRSTSYGVALAIGVYFLTACGRPQMEFFVRGKFRGFTCDASQRTPSSETVRRLTRTQYLHTLYDLLVQTLGQTNGPSVYNHSAIAALFADVPEEVSTKTLIRGIDQSTSAPHARAYYRISLAIAQRVLTQNYSLLSSGGQINCTLSNISCWLQPFGRRALRRPLTNQEITRYTNLANSRGPETVLGTLLAAPEFVQHARVGNTAAGSSVPLTAHELASRLSYLYWQSMPDDALFAAADSGALLNQSELRNQTERLLNDPKASRGHDALTTAWLRLEEQLGLPPAISGPLALRYPAVTDIRALRDHMTAETKEFYRQVVSTGGNFSRLHLSREAYPRHPDLAQVYGTPVWPGAGAPVNFPDGQRAGLVGRNNLVEGDGSRDILRGARVMNEFLCHHMPVPADTMTPAGAVFYIGQTTRQRISAMTEIPGTSCAGCHGAINPLGFVLGNFDGVGGHRIVEPIHLPSGQLHSSPPIDAAVLLPAQFFPNRNAASQPELSARLVEAGWAQACMARYYFRFAYQRLEQLPQDGCALKELHEPLSRGAPIIEALKAISEQPEFTRRTRP